MQDDHSKLRPGRKRYDRERWMQTALNVLAQEGGAKLRVESIAAALNVTKGSFYHHFRNRSDFINALSEYWVSNFTEVVISEIGALETDGSGKLRAVMQLVAERELDKYDIAFRSWAAQDPDVFNAVKKVDIARYRFIRSLFVEMGFAGQDLECRVRAWLVFASASRSVNFPRVEPECEPEIDTLLDFFTGTKVAKLEAQHRLASQ